VDRQPGPRDRHHVVCPARGASFPLSKGRRGGSTASRACCHTSRALAAPAAFSPSSHSPKPPADRPPSVPQVVYFGRCLPFVIIDRIPYFNKWKLQPGKVPTAKQQWDCTKLVLLSHFTVELPQVRLPLPSRPSLPPSLAPLLTCLRARPQIWGFHPMAEYFGMSTHSVPFPALRTIAWQVALFFVFEDTFHYFAHRWLHTPMLYKVRFPSSLPPFLPLSASLVPAQADATAASTLRARRSTSTSSTMSSRLPSASRPSTPTLSKSSSSAPEQSAVPFSLPWRRPTCRPLLRLASSFTSSPSTSGLSLGSSRRSRPTRATTSLGARGTGFPSGRAPSTTTTTTWCVPPSTLPAQHAC
jgi:hypothetical protein